MAIDSEVSGGPSVHGEYELIKADGKPTYDTKGRIWKVSYHEIRALMNVRERLNRLASAAQ